MRNVKSILIGFLIVLPIGLYVMKSNMKEPVPVQVIDFSRYVINEEIEEAYMDTKEEIYNIGNIFGEPVAMESTSYCESGITADGSKTRVGICAAKKEWIGRTAILYENRNGEIGDLLGIWEIKDTGGDYRIKNGRCIDIWLETEKEAREWGRKQVYVQIINAEG